MQRNPYIKISALDRERLVNSYKDGGDWQNVARILGIKRQTARNVIAVYQRQTRIHTLPKGGDRRSLVDEDMLGTLMTYVAEKPTATLDEMRLKLMQELPTKPAVSLNTISRALDGQLITLKDVRTVPFQWNSDEVKRERKDYAQWLLATGVNRNTVFLDEFGANIWTARTKGRSPLGQRAVRIVEGQRGSNLTVCLAVSPQWGLVHWMFVNGGFTQEKFSDFLLELESLIDEPFTVLCDNAKPHGDPPVLAPHHQLLFLPRYSPFLNTAERAGSSMKSAVKRFLSTPVIQAELADRQAALQQHQTLHGWRTSILQREMEKALQSITTEKCRKWFNKGLQYCPRCLNNENIFS
jgi:transposase